MIVKFCSTRDNSIQSRFSNAVLQGLAPDGGLFVPSNIPSIDHSKWQDCSSLAECGRAFIPHFVEGEMSDEQLDAIIDEALNFEIPLVEVEENIYSLELFHGPTLAFKDVGARFMGRMLPVFNQGNDEALVLVATSGDTGGAVANGLYNVPGVRVVVLYPEGKVSPLQEKQFASLGGNITALAVDGVFDDCQRLVKTAFEDKEITGQYNLTTANSINIARWLPQAIYYFWMYAQLGEAPVVSVPSGNFGNFTAGFLANKTGLPIKRFIAACNANDTIPQYLISGEYHAKPSVETVANAMDVGDPSNFERLLYLFNENTDIQRKEIGSASYTDAEILETIKDCKERTEYLLDPHGACAYRALKEQLKVGEKGVFLATAHPAKFSEVYTNIGMEEPRHPTLEALRDKTVLSHKISANLDDLKRHLKG